MSLFENFPYTNLHNLNLDWITKIIKDFSEKYPTLIDDLNKKLNKPVIDENGNINDVLLSNGDGSTRWGSISQSFLPEIYEAVYSWLDEHPEATTTVQDDSLTMAKLVDDLKYMVKRNQSGYLAPVYIGDYLQSFDYLPSSVVRVGDDFIVIDAPTREYATNNSTGDGYIKTFSLVSNAKTSEITRLVGHGNSIAFDGTNYYVVPIWEYLNNTEVPAQKVYVYDSNFILIMTLQAPVSGHAVSFDPVTQKLYFLATDTIYEIVNMQFQLYSVITNFNLYEESIILARSYNQDMAIYNDEFYISSPQGNILHGRLTPAVCDISDSFYLQYSDSTERFIMGELEGFEFDSEGHLYAVEYTNIINNELRNAFIVEIPVNHTPNTSPNMGGIFAADDPSLTLSEATQAAFYLNTYEIRTLNQLLVRMNQNYSRVNIPDANNVIDNYSIRFMHPLAISFAGNYTCKSMTIMTPTVNLYAPNDTHLVTFTTSGYPINLERTGALMITGMYPLNVSTPNITDNATNNLINVGYYKSLTQIRLGVNSRENYTLRIGNRKIVPEEVYSGAAPLVHLNPTYQLSYATGFISESSKVLRFHINLPKPTATTPVFTGSITVRGCQGYIDGSSSSALISLTDTTNYAFNVVVKNTNAYILEIRKVDDSAFTNIVNNTILFANGTIDISQDW